MNYEEDMVRLNALFYELAHKYGVEKAMQMFADTTDIVTLIASVQKKED